MKEKVTISLKQLRLLLLVLILLVLLASYYFGVRTLLEKRDVLETQNQVLQASIVQLDEKIAQEESYRTITSQALQAVIITADRYAAGITPESTLQLVRSMEEATGVSVPSVSFGAETPFFTENRLLTPLGGPIIASSATVTLQYRANYADLKECIEYFYSYPERVSVSSITAAFDRTSGLLSGAMTLTLYAVSGVEREYEAPWIGDIPIGLEDLFRTVGGAE